MTDKFQLPKFKVGDVVFIKDTSFAKCKIKIVKSVTNVSGTKYFYTTSIYGDCPEDDFFKTREELFQYQINKLVSNYSSPIIEEDEMEPVR